MKRLYTLASALAIGATAMMAQTMIVVDKSGEQHRFGVDRITQITFEEIQEAPLEMKPSFISDFGGGNVNMIFEDEDGRMLSLDIYGPEDATYLHAGTYTFNTTCSPFTVSTEWSFFLPNGSGDYDSQVAPASGTMKVEDNEGVYTFDFDITFADETTLKARYEGELDSYSSKPAEVKKIEFAYAAMKKVDISDQQPGQFRLQGNDASWNYDSRLDLWADPEATTLPAGTYTLSRSDEHSIGSMYYKESYIEIYDANIPSADRNGYIRFTEATVTVEKEGTTYTIDITGKLNNGYDCHITYTGEISNM